MNFGRLVCRVTHHTNKACDIPLNLLIEAPLSVAFDKNDNPTGRKFIDPSGKNHRYWYEQPGVGMMAAALYLVRAVIDAGIGREVRLFEGLASFKEGKSDHKKDVEDLRNMVKNGVNMRIRYPEEHAGDTCLKSAFAVIDPARFAEGIPPVVYTKESWRKLNENL